MEATDWISVKDKLPKINERVLVCVQFSDNSFFPCIAAYIGKGAINDTQYYRWYSDDGFDIDGTTHWQKIIFPKKK